MENGFKPSLIDIDSLRKLFEKSTVPGFDVPDFGVHVASNAFNRQTLIDLNKQLEEYLKKVKDLKKTNQSLEEQIIKIESEKKVYHGQDWNLTQKNLEGRELQIKKIAEEIAKLTLQIKTTNLDKEDFESKLKEETELRRKMEKELMSLENISVLQKQQQNLRSEIELLNANFQQQKTEHETRVEVLCKEIKESKVMVEIKSQKSNLADIVKKIREKYDTIAKKNMEDINAWYQREIKAIEHQEANYLSQLESAKSVLINLEKEKKMLEIEIETLTTQYAGFEVTLVETRDQIVGNKENIANLEKKLKELIAQIDEQKIKNQKLLNITGNLQEQIQAYKHLVESGYEKNASSHN